MTTLNNGVVGKSTIDLIIYCINLRSPFITTNAVSLIGERRDADLILYIYISIYILILFYFFSLSGIWLGKRNHSDAANTVSLCCLLLNYVRRLCPIL